MPAGKGSNSMIKALLRFFGYLATGLAFAVLFVDGVRSIARDAFVFTPLENFWRLLEPASLLNARRWLAGLDASLQGAVEVVFTLPAALWLLLAGLLLAFLGRKRRLIAPQMRTK